MKLTRRPYPLLKAETPLDGDELREPELPHRIARLFTKLREPELDLVRKHQEKE